VRRVTRFVLACALGLAACEVEPDLGYGARFGDAASNGGAAGTGGVDNKTGGTGGMGTGGAGGTGGATAGSAGTGGSSGSAIDASAFDAPSERLDAASVDVAKDAAVDSEAGATCPYRLCETFEGTAEGAIPAGWEKVASTGSIGVVSGMANRGSRSLHVLAPSGSYETYIRHTKSFPVPDDTFYGRLFLRIAARRHAPMNILHWTVFEARGSNSNNRVRYGGIENGFAMTNAWLFNVETMGMGEKGIDDDPDVQTNPGRWYCAEWMYKGTAGANESRLWVDGAERPKMHVTGSTFDGIYAMPTFNSLYVGWAIYQPMDGPYEVWIDDVAIDAQKLGCDR
jgi:hypothetical protein